MIAPFEWARRERIVIAMSGRAVYTSEGEAVGIEGGNDVTVSDAQMSSAIADR